MPGKQAMFGWEYVYTKFYGVPVDRCHPGLTDLFVKKFREESERKPSILAKLNEPAPKTTPPKKTKSKGMEL